MLRSNADRHPLAQFRGGVQAGLAPRRPPCEKNMGGA
jgi:hypothetical protein